jgi:hypothetical protein
MKRFLLIGSFVVLGLVGAVFAIPALADSQGNAATQSTDQYVCPFHKTGGGARGGCCGAFTPDQTTPNTDTPTTGGNASGA